MFVRSFDKEANPNNTWNNATLGSFKNDVWEWNIAASCRVTLVSVRILVEILENTRWHETIDLWEQSGFSELESLVYIVSVFIFMEDHEG